MPPLFGITWVPPSIWSSWCGVAAHAETVKTKTTPPSQAIAFFMPRFRSRVLHVLIPSTIGYGNLKFPTKFRVCVPLKLLRIRGPTGNDPDQAVVLLPIFCVF